MLRSASLLLADEDGVIVSAELVLITTVVVIGCIAGLAALGHAVNSELVGCAQACQNMSSYYPQPPLNNYPGNGSTTYPTYPAPPSYQTTDTSPWGQGDIQGYTALP